MRRSIRRSNPSGRHRHRGESLRDGFDIGTGRSIRRRGGTGGGTTGGTIGGTDGLFDCLQRFGDGVHGVIIPIDAQLAGASHDQPRVAGFGVVAHLVVSVIRGEQRIDDSLRTTGNLIRTLIHELRIGDRHVVTGHDPCGHAGHPHLQVLTVFRVIVHLLGVGQRPQFDQSGADGAASRTAGFIDTWAIAVASSWNAISLLRFHCPPTRGTFRRAGCQVPVAGTAGHRVTAPPATRRLPLRGVVTSDRYAAAVSPGPRRMRTFSRASPQPSSLCIVPAHAALTRLAPQGRHM